MNASGRCPLTCRQPPKIKKPALLALAPHVVGGRAQAQWYARDLPEKFELAFRPEAGIQIARAIAPHLPPELQTLIMGYDAHFWDDYTCVTKGTCSPAEASIKELIEHLDYKKEEAMERTFKGVAKHFSEVFRELVPGGSGKLVMKTAAPAPATASSVASAVTRISCGMRPLRATNSP